MAHHHHAEINPQVRDARQKQQNRHWENYQQRHDGQHQHHLKGTRKKKANHPVAEFAILTATGAKIKKFSI